MKKLVLAILVTTSMLSSQLVGADQTKPADQCIDGICIGDDLGQLSKIKWNDPGKKESLSQEHIDLIKQCGQSNSNQWKEKSLRMCEILAKSILEISPPEEIINWFKENPAPVCNFDAIGNFNLYLQSNNSLGKLSVKVGFSEFGRAEVFEIAKEFSEVKNGDDKKIIFDKLLEKHKPYLKKEDLLRANIVNTPWGGAVQIMDNPIDVRLRVIDESLFGRRNPSKGVCTPTRKEISVM